MVLVFEERYLLVLFKVLFLILTDNLAVIYFLGSQSIFKKNAGMSTGTTLFTLDISVKLKIRSDLAFKSHQAQPVDD